MKDICKFFIELGKLFEIAEQEAPNKNETTIYNVAVMYLNINNIALEDLKKALLKYDKNDDAVLLLKHIEWKAKTKKKAD